MIASQVIIKDEKYKRIARSICKDNYEDLFQDAWLKIREIELKGVELNINYFYFHRTCRSILLDNLTRRVIPIQQDYDFTNSELTSEDYTESIYRQAVDEFLCKNDNELTDVVKLYIELNSLRRIARETGIEVKTVINLFKDAKDSIRIIANRLADDSNGYIHPY